jgi:hypothetical protein
VSNECLSLWTKNDLPRIHNQRNDGLIVVMYLYGKVVCQGSAGAIGNDWEVIFTHLAEARYTRANSDEFRGLTTEE